MWYIVGSFAFPSLKRSSMPRHSVKTVSVDSMVRMFSIVYLLTSFYKRWRNAKSLERSSLPTALTSKRTRTKTSTPINKRRSERVQIYVRWRSCPRPSKRGKEILLSLTLMSVISWPLLLNPWVLRDIWYVRLSTNIRNLSTIRRHVTLIESITRTLKNVCSAQCEMTITQSKNMKKVTIRYIYTEAIDRSNQMRLSAYGKRRSETIERLRGCKQRHGHR